MHSRLLTCSALLQFVKRSDARCWYILLSKEPEAVNLLIQGHLSDANWDVKGDHDRIRLVVSTATRTRKIILVGKEAPGRPSLTKKRTC